MKKSALRPRSPTSRSCGSKFIRPSKIRAVSAEIRPFEAVESVLKAGRCGQEGRRQTIFAENLRQCRKKPPDSAKIKTEKFGHTVQTG